MSDPYKDNAHLYTALMAPETLTGQALENDAMTQAVKALPDSAAILDAACGAGYDVISIANGLPESFADRTPAFEVAGSDISPAMIEQAHTNIKDFESRTGQALNIDLRQCAFKDLGNFTDWRGKFDLVLVPHAIYTIPDHLSYEDYDEYLLQSLRGVREVMKPGALLMLDNRDWDGQFDQFDEVLHSADKDGITYYARYKWCFGPQINSMHRADITFWAENDPDTTAHLVYDYAGKTKDDLRDLFQKSGLTLKDEDRITLPPEQEPFITYTLRLE